MAVLFADICDSSRLYETLGDRQALDHINRTLGLIGAAARDSGGRVVKTIGDELMCTFPDATDAAEAARRMQQAVAQGSGFIGRSMNIRIGMHLGPVIAEGSDVFGDAVNVAARLVAMARAGQILVSRDAVGGMPQPTAAAIRDIDLVPVKGRQQPVAVCDIPWTAAEDQTVCVRGGDGPRPAAGPSILELAHGAKRVHCDTARGRFSFGRDPACDLVLSDRMASREHARIEWTGDGWILVDLSSNGTWLAFDGQPEIRLRRQQVLLHGRGRIGFGHACGQAESESAEFNLV